MRRIGSAAITLGVALGLTLACGSSLRTVPEGPHRESDPAWLPVQFAPPPAKVETLPPDPGEPCAWLDGRWEWRGRNWEWRSGAWVVPAAGCYFAPPIALWAPSTGTGVLFYRPGRWYSERDGSACAEPRACK